MNSASYSISSREGFSEAAEKPFRKMALWAGVIYLITFVSVPTLSLYVPVHNPNYITGSGSDTPIIIGGILELIVGLAGIATAVVLYPVLKNQNESAALGLVAARVLEATLIFAGVACLLTIVTIKQSNPGSDGIITGHALVTMYDKIFLVSQSLIPAICDLLLGVLFYQSRLIPRTLAVIGIVGAFMLVAGDIGVLFGALEQRAPSTAMAAIGVAVFEFVLGIWLVVKGFSKNHRLAYNAR